MIDRRVYDRKRGKEMKGKEEREKVKWEVSEQVDVWEEVVYKDVLRFEEI